MTGVVRVHLVQDVLDALADLGLASSESVRIGFDVVSVSAFSHLLTTVGGRAMTKTAFTEAEREYAAGRPERLAARWAAKEAVSKAIGTGFRGLRPGEIEILHHTGGQPSLAPVGGATWPRDAHTWTWSLTLCHEGDAAIAFAVALAPEAPMGAHIQPTRGALPHRDPEIGDPR